MRNPRTISEEIRAVDVKTAEIDTELIQLTAKESLTPGEQQRHAQLSRASEKLQLEKADLEAEHRNALTERAEQLEEIRIASQNPNAVEAGFPTVVSGKKLSDRQLWGSEPTFRGQSHRDMANRAEAILERATDFGPVDPAAIDRIGALVGKNEGNSYAARFVAASSDPEYVRALEKTAFGANDANGRLIWTESEKTAFLRAEEFRTAMSTTAGNGGYLIPFSLDPTIGLTNAGSVNPLRQISRVETVSTGVWHGVTSAGVSASWNAEAAEVSDASPTFSQPTISTVRGDCHVIASIEVESDSNIGQQLGTLFADAKNNLEASAFVNGTGSTQPYGISYRLTNTTASRVDSNTNQVFGIVDVYALVNNLPARAQDNASWLGHWSTANLIRRMGEGSVGASAFWTDLGPGIPPQLLGAPFHLASAMDSTIGTATSSNDDVLILGNFQEFCIVDALGSVVKYDPLVLGSNRRPTGEVSWTMFFRTGSDVLDSGQFRQLRV